MVPAIIWTEYKMCISLEKYFKQAFAETENGDKSSRAIDKFVHVSREEPQLDPVSPNICFLLMPTIHFYSYHYFV